MNGKKTIVFLCSLIMILLFALSCLESNEISIQLPGILWVNQYAYTFETVSLSITGKKYKNEFYGDIAIYFESKEWLSMQDISLIYRKYDGYWEIRSKGNGAIGDNCKLYGFCLIGQNWDRFSFFLYADEPSWFSSDANVYTFPANNRQDAMEITKQLVEGSSWLNESRWE